MIRFFHTSDWHLGRSLYGQSLIEDQKHALEGLLLLIDERKPHALLIAGDVFDRALPPEAAVSLFDRFLDEAARKRRLPVFLIPGNHDSRERVGFAASLLRDQRLVIFAKLEDSLRPVKLAADGVEAWIYGLPFVEPIEIGQQLGRDDLRTPDAATRAFCRAMLDAKPDASPAILLAHAFVAGGEISESEKEIFIGGSSQVDASAFDGFVYTALGHLHKPQRAGRDGVRYSGSLLHYSKSEIGHEKSITEITLGPDGIPRRLEHARKPLRALRYIEGSLAEMLASSTSDASRSDYLIAGFTDDGAVLDAFARLRAAYPNLLHVSRAGGFVPASLPGLKREREEMSDLELFSEFFRDATGADMSDRERAALIEVIKKESPTEVAQ